MKRLGVDGVTAGAGYGKADPALITSAEDKHTTAFVNYTTGPISFGIQVAKIDIGLAMVLLLILKLDLGE